MATTTLDTAEAGKSDSLTIAISPKSTLKVAEQSVISQKVGVTPTQSLWYRAHAALVGAGILVND